MAKGAGTEWFRKENRSGRATRMKLERSALLIGRREKASSAGARKANGDGGKRLGRKLIYQGRETTSNTLMLNQNDFVLIYILIRRT